MAQADIDTLNIINNFIGEARKTLSSDKVVLFGSRASGRQSQWSDIDIIVASDDFIGIDFIQRLTTLGKIAWQAKATEIEALGFTSNEYDSASELDFLWQIKQNGKVVA